MSSIEDSNTVDKVITSHQPSNNITHSKHITIEESDELLVDPNQRSHHSHVEKIDNGVEGAPIAKTAIEIACTKQAEIAVHDVNKSILVQTHAQDGALVIKEEDEQTIATRIKTNARRISAEEDAMERSRATTQDNNDNYQENEKEEDDKTIITDLLETLVDRVECRWLIVDDGNASDFPHEGVCFVPLQIKIPSKYKGEKELVRNILWPSWLIAKQKESIPNIQKVRKHNDTKEESGDIISSSRRKDKTMRTVCCYGDGRCLEIDESFLLPFEECERQQHNGGGSLWSAAIKQAKARCTCPDEFISMVFQNIEHCAAPVLLGRLWATEQERNQRKRLTRGNLVAVKWNACDWWPARVIFSREDGTGIEVEYDDDDETRLEMKWPADDAYILDDAKHAIDYDSDDAEILEEGLACNVATFEEDGSESEEGEEESIVKSRIETKLQSQESNNNQVVQKKNSALTNNKKQKLKDSQVKTIKSTGKSGQNVVNTVDDKKIESKEDRSHLEAKASADALRKSVRLKLQMALVFSTTDELKALTNIGCKPDDVLEAAVLAAAIEREIFSQTRNSDTIELGSSSLVGVAYKRKLRQLAFNLRKNLNLRARVCTSKLGPSNLVKLDAEALASDEVQKQREIAREKALYHRQTSSSLKYEGGEEDPKARRERLEIESMLETTINPKKQRRTITLDSSGLPENPNTSTLSVARPRGVGKMRRPAFKPPNRLGELLADISKTSKIPTPSNVSIDTVNGASTTFETIMPLGDVDDDEGNILPLCHENNILPDPVAFTEPSVSKIPASVSRPSIESVSITTPRTTPTQPQQPQPQPPNIKLPAGWVTRYSSRKGSWYYVEENTGESRWDPPPLPGAGKALSLISAKNTSSSKTATTCASPKKSVKFAPDRDNEVESKMQQITGNIVDIATNVKDFEARIAILELLILKGDVAGVRAMVCIDESLLVSLIERNDNLLEVVERLLSVPSSEVSKVNKPSPQHARSGRPWWERDDGSWNCVHCNNLNSSNRTHCVAYSCGKPKPLDPNAPRRGDTTTKSPPDQKGDKKHNLFMCGFQYCSGTYGHDHLQRDCPDYLQHTKGKTATKTEITYSKLANNSNWVASSEKSSNQNLWNQKGNVGDWSESKLKNETWTHDSSTSTSQHAQDNSKEWENPKNQQSWRNNDNMVGGSYSQDHNSSWNENTSRKPKQSGDAWSFQNESNISVNESRGNPNHDSWNNQSNKLSSSYSSAAPDKHQARVWTAEVSSNQKDWSANSTKEGHNSKRKIDTISSTSVSSSSKTSKSTDWSSPRRDEFSRKSVDSTNSRHKSYTSDDNYQGRDFAKYGEPGDYSRSHKGSDRGRSDELPRRSGETGSYSNKTDKRRATGHSVGSNTKSSRSIGDSGSFGGVETINVQSIKNSLTLSESAPSSWSYDLQVAMTKGDLDGVKTVLSSQPRLLNDLATGKGKVLPAAEQKANEQLLVKLEQMLDKAATKASQKKPPLASTQNSVSPKTSKWGDSNSAVPSPKTNPSKWGDSNATPSPKTKPSKWGDSNATPSPKTKPSKWGDSNATPPPKTKLSKWGDSNATVPSLKTNVSKWSDLPSAQVKAAISSAVVKSSMISSSWGNKSTAANPSQQQQQPQPSQPLNKGRYENQNQMQSSYHRQQDPSYAPISVTPRGPPPGPPPKTKPSSIPFPPNSQPQQCYQQYGEANHSLIWNQYGQNPSASWDSPPLKAMNSGKGGKGKGKGKGWS